MDFNQYKQKIEDFKVFLENDIIKVVQPDADVRLRYTTSQGKDDEKHLGFLRNDDGKVDCWQVFFTGFRGLPPSEKGSMSSVNKPLRFVIEYYLDYNIEIEADNTQDLFDSRMLHLDFLFEKKFSCLPNDFVISGWQAVSSLRRFNSATTHFATVVCDIIAEGLDF